MTIDQTRQMAVEFERRLNDIDSTTASINKIDTDTIFSYLNQYQTIFIQQLYAAEDQTENGTRGALRISDIIKNFITRDYLYTDGSCTTDEISEFFKLPDDYYMYIRSNSVVTGTYKNLEKQNVVPNTTVKQSDAEDIIRSYYNSDGILRNPVVILSGPTSDEDKGYLQIVHDKYTDIKRVELVYYREPKRFNIINNEACELPYECFDDLVQGGVDLYFQTKYKLAIAEAAARRRPVKYQDD